MHINFLGENIHRFREIYAPELRLDAAGKEYPQVNNNNLEKIFWETLLKKHSLKLTSINASSGFSDKWKRSQSRIIKKLIFIPFRVFALAPGLLKHDYHVIIRL